MTGPTLQAGPTPRGAYLALAALFAMNLLNYIDRFILAAVINPVGEELQIDQGQQGFLFTVFFISYSIFSPLFGWLGDRMTRKVLLAVGVGVWSLATFASGLARSFEEMILARSVLGIGEASYATLAPALIGDLFPRERRNRALTIFYVAIPVGAALGYVLGGQFHAWFGWRAAFRIVGLPGLLVALAALGLREPRRGESEDLTDEERAHSESLPLSPDMYKALGRNRSYVLNTLAMAMSTFALGGLQAWTPAFLERERGMTNDYANQWLGVMVFLSGLIGTPAGGWLAERLARRMKGAYFWLSGVTMLFSVPFIVVALSAPWDVVIFTGILIGLSLAVMNYGPSNAIIVNVTSPKVRAAAFAVNILLIHLLGDIPSPFIIGAVSELAGKNLFLGLGVTIPALIASGVLYCLGARHLEPDQEAVLRELRGKTG